MGGTHLVEGFDRSEVETVMRWHGLSKAERAETWPLLRDAEHAIRQALAAKREIVSEADGATSVVSGSRRLGDIIGAK
jgi:hypothetical protein